jgi:hypothetical protein
VKEVEKKRCVKKMRREEEVDSRVYDKMAHCQLTGGATTMRDLDID